MKIYARIHMINLVWSSGFYANSATEMTTESNLVTIAPINLNSND